MRQLTPLMLPTSLQPSLTGPRDALRVHTIASPEDDAKPSAAPASTKSKGNTMNPSPNVDAILGALKKKSPADTAALNLATGISIPVLGVTLSKMTKENRITRVGRGVYALPGAKVDAKAPTKPAKPSAPTKRVEKHNIKSGISTSPRAGGSFAAGVAQVEREMDAAAASSTRLARIESTPGVDNSNGAHLAHLIRLQRDTITEATSIPPRAIQKADGGAIVLRGNMLTAELDAESLAVIRQL